MTTLRLRFRKLGKVRFVSHRDVARIWERALRKADLPVARTEGFSPRPKLAFGLALSTGHESIAEYLDVTVTQPCDVETLAERLDPALPEGIDVTAAAVLEPGAPSLQESVTSCTWRIEALDVDVPTAEHLAAVALGADELVLSRTRKGKVVVDELRPALLSLLVSCPTAAGTELEAELGVHPRSLRPSELLSVLRPDRPLEGGRVMRLAQWTWLDGARHEPLATSAAPREDPHVRPRDPTPAGADPAERDGHPGADAAADGVTDPGSERDPRRVGAAPAVGLRTG
jgi:radical SAM-linked protein